MWLESGAPLAIKCFGGLSVGYALFNLAILFSAWRHTPGPLNHWAALAAGLYFLAMVMSAAAADGIEAMEQSALVLAAIMLFVNWLAVKRAIGINLEKTRSEPSRQSARSKIKN